MSDASEPKLTECAIDDCKMLDTIRRMSKRLDRARELLAARNEMDSRRKADNEIQLAKRDLQVISDHIVQITYDPDCPLTGDNEPSFH